MSRAPLTDLAIRGLAPAAGARDEIWDAKVPGLGLRASAHGTKTFVVMYRLDGRKCRVTLGRYPIVTLAEARERARDILNQVSKGIDPQSRSETAPAGRLFTAIVDDFVRKYCRQHNRASTAHETERILRARFVPAWGDRPIASITTQDVRAVMTAIMEAGTPSAANHALAAIRKLFNWCVEEDLIGVSPCARVRRPAPVGSRERVLTDDELGAVWCAAERLDGAFSGIVRLLILTAQRRGEVAGMRWSELDLTAQTWTIPGSRTKNHDAHVLPLSARVAGLVRLQPRTHDELVFPARGNEQSTFSGFSKLKRRLEQLSRVQEFTLHDLRRTAATGMARLGVAPHVVERVLNHSTGTFGGVAGIYNRFAYLPEMRQALELWSAHVAGLAEARTSNAAEQRSSA